MRYLWEYEAHSRELIVTTKYNPSLRLAKALGQYLAHAYLSWSPDLETDCLITIPPSLLSLTQRKFHFGSVLADSLSRITPKKIPYLPSALIHQGYSAPQASLVHKRRLSNVRNTFSANPRLISGKHLILIDDVITTGATIASAALALKHAGAQSISALALCRSPNWREFRFEIYKRYEEPFLRSEPRKNLQI